MTRYEGSLGRTRQPSSISGCNRDRGPTELLHSLPCHALRMSRTFCHVHLQHAAKNCSSAIPHVGINVNPEAYLMMPRPTQAG